MPLIVPPPSVFRRRLPTRWPTTLAATQPLALTDLDGVCGGDLVRNHRSRSDHRCGCLYSVLSHALASVSDHSRYTTPKRSTRRPPPRRRLTTRRPQQKRISKGASLLGDLHWDTHRLIGTCPPRPRLPPPQQTPQEAHTQRTPSTTRTPPLPSPRPSLGLSTASSSSANSGLPQPGGGDGKSERDESLLTANRWNGRDAIRRCCAAIRTRL
jgi:hypothetical protein